MIVARTDNGEDAAGLLGNRDWQAYAARVGADWTLLAEAVAAAQKGGRISGELWQAFAGDHAAWSQFYAANKSPILPVVGTGNLDAWATRARAWDEKLKKDLGAGVAGPGVAGAMQTSGIASAAAAGADLARSVAWLALAGAGVWWLWTKRKEN